MPWDRGAWERRTSEGGSYKGPNLPHSSPEYKKNKSKRVLDKKTINLKENINKFISLGWNISEKKEGQYLNNNYFNSPYRLNNISEIPRKIENLISNKSSKNNFLVVSNNDSILNEIELDLSSESDYIIFNSFNSLKNLVSNVEDFERVNSDLFDKYAIKLFTDLNHFNKIPNLKILSYDVCYINNNDIEVLNDFLKDYWKFYEISKFSDIDLTFAERDINSEIRSLSIELTSINNYINRLNKILNLLDFDIDNLNEFDLEIINNNPELINKNDINDFLKSLDSYQKINKVQLSPSSEYFKEFPKNSFILGIITNFKRYVDSQRDYQEINENIINLKNYFESLGLYFNNLNEYYEVKDHLAMFKNAVYLENEDYFILNDKLKEFLKLNSSFNDYFKHCKENVVLNSNSDKIYLRVNNAINSILGICEDLGIEINSFSDLNNHKSDFELLSEYIKFNKKNTVANEETIKEYASNLFSELKEIDENLIQEVGDVDSSELDLIMYHISTLKRMISKIGINISSLNDLNNNFSIIANLENDISSNIFTNIAEDYIHNEKFQIDNDLDSFKHSLNYLSDHVTDRPYLKDYSIEDLSNSFSNQYKLNFLKSNIESCISSTISFEDIIENYNELILNTKNLMGIIDNFEYDDKLNKMLNEFNSISQMYEEGNYSNDQLMIDNVSSYKDSINNDFNKLTGNGIFSKDKINECNVEESLTELDVNIKTIQDFIKVNGFDNTDFDEIIKKNNENILKNDEIKQKLDNSDIYNFYDLLIQLNEQNHEYDLVNEILTLSSKLNINEYEEFSKFTLQDIVSFSQDLENNIEFTKAVNNGFIAKEFDVSENQLNNLDFKIDSIKNNLNDLNLDSSSLDNFSQIDISGINEIKEKLIKIDYHLNFDSSDIDELIKNYEIVLDMLLNLCNDYNVEFSTGSHKFNSSDFKFNLEGIKEDFDDHVKLYKFEKEFSDYEDIIKNNLDNIWEGPQTDLEIIKSKLKIDEKFTDQYNKGIYTDKTIANLSEISNSDLIFLNDLKNIGNQKLKSNYILAYKNREILVPEILKFNHLKKDDFSSFLEIFKNINKIYHSDKITEGIKLLEYNIQHFELINLINEYENNLKSYSVVYYNYFNRREFDMPVEELLQILENHLKFTELINLSIINERYVDTIKDNFDDFSSEVDELDVLKNKIINECKYHYGEKDVSFDEIKKGCGSLNNSNVVLSDLDTLRNIFDSNYESYFDYVYVVDDPDLTDEDKLQLFLISQNKISNLKLKDV